MLRYLILRLASLTVTLWIASLVVFIVIEIVPGDPASYMLGMNAQDDTVAALRSELGLDQPKLWRYWDWVTGMLQGDFGRSYTYRSPVAEMIAERLKVSLPLAVYALLLSLLIAFPAGIFSASRRGGIVDTSVMGFTQLGIAIPNFWFALILVLLFAVKSQVLYCGKCVLLSGICITLSSTNRYRHHQTAACNELLHVTTCKASNIQSFLFISYS